MVSLKVRNVLVDFSFPWDIIYCEERVSCFFYMKAEYTLLTKIPMLPDGPKGMFSVLNDPDTGIRLPGEKNQSEEPTHITTNTIAHQMESGALCIITFDQSDYRNIGIKRDQQRKIKMRNLAAKGLHSFYYVSHAPFLFAAPDSQSLDRIKGILQNAGIPE